MRANRSLRLTSTILLLATCTGAAFIGCGTPPTSDSPCGIACAVDAAVPDAGALDSGAPDAGEPDAGDVEDAGELEDGGDDAGIADGGSPDAGAPDGGAPGMTPEDFVTAFVHAVCQRDARCGAFADADACLDWDMSPARFADRLASLELGVDLNRVVIDASDALVCLANLEADPCNSNLLFTWEVPSCLSALEGRQLAGEPCFSWLECTASTFCDLSATCPGLCTPRPGLGETAQEEGVCKAGLRRAPDSTCQPFAGAGESCAWDSDCVSGHSCAEGVCVAVTPEGAPCSSMAECSGYLVCGDGGTCQQLPVVGEPCNGVCKYDLRCESGSYGGPGTCAPRSLAGGECWTWLDCAGSLDCEGADAAGGQKGTCFDPTTHGPACTGSSECGSDRYCENGVCRPLKYIAESCAAPNECRTGICEGTCRTDLTCR